MSTSPTEESFSRIGIARALGCFVRGENSLEELRRRMTPVFVRPDIPATPDDQPLTARIALLIEDDSISESQHRDVARLLVCALESGLPNERVIALMPLLAKVPRLRAIVQALDAEKLTRTSFLAFVGNSRLPQDVKQWLTHASIGRIHQLLQALDACALEDVESLLGGGGTESSAR